MVGECLNCLQSTAGYCGQHKIDDDVVYVTSTYTPVRKYTKREVEIEVMYYAKLFCKLKWYQPKKQAIKDLKHWVDFLKKFK